MTTQNLRFYIHIGQPKTGTTTLQSTLRAMSAGLHQKNILYPVSTLYADHPNHTDIAEIARRGMQSDLDQAIQKIVDQAKSTDSVLISSEMFYTLDDPEKLIQTIRKFFPNHKVETIVYAREYISSVLSSWTHTIKSSGRTIGPIDFARLQSHTFPEAYRLWQQSSDTVTLKLYDRASLFMNDINADMLQYLGVGDLIDSIPETNDPNFSISGNLLGLKLIMNMLGIGTLIPYLSWGEAAKLDQSFTGAVTVDEDTVNRLSQITSTNKFLEGKLASLKAFDPKKGSLVFDLERWDDDMKIISEHPDFWLAQGFPLSHIKKGLKDNKIEPFDPGRLFSNIKEPPEDFRHKYIGNENFRTSKKYYHMNLSLKKKDEQKLERIKALETKNKALRARATQQAKALNKSNEQLRRQADTIKAIQAQLGRQADTN